MKKFVFWLTIMILGFMAFIITMVNIQVLENYYYQVFYFLLIGSIIMFILGLVKAIKIVFIDDKEQR